MKNERAAGLVAGGYRETKLASRGRGEFGLVAGCSEVSTRPRSGRQHHKHDLSGTQSSRPKEVGGARQGSSLTSRPARRGFGAFPGLEEGVSVNPSVAGRAGAARAGTHELGLPSHTPRGI